jgi:hypothetical protein
MSVTASPNNYKNGIAELMNKINLEILVSQKISENKNLSNDVRSYQYGKLSTLIDMKLKLLLLSEEVIPGPLSLDAIIRHMEGTKPEEWATDVVRTAGGENCFFGHLFNYGGNLLWGMFEELYATEYMIYPVNDGTNKKYPQATAKERVLAYLKDLRDGKAKTTRQLMDE